MGAGMKIGKVDKYGNDSVSNGVRKLMEAYIMVLGLEAYDALRSDEDGSLPRLVIDALTSVAGRAKYICGEAKMHLRDCVDDPDFSLDGMQVTGLRNCIRDIEARADRVYCHHRDAYHRWEAANNRE